MLVETHLLLIVYAASIYSNYPNSRAVTLFCMQVLLPKKEVRQNYYLLQKRMFKA